MRERITSILRHAVEERIFPGCVIGFIDDQKIEVLSFGKLTYEESSPNVREDTVYDVASITKSIPTSMLALSLVDQKKISLANPISEYIPELTTKYRKEITLWHLLTHTVAFDVRLSLLKDLPPQDILLALFNAQLRDRPGNSFAYVNGTSLLLGIYLERVTGEKLESLSKEMFFSPLQMKRTTFHPEIFPEEQIAPSEIDRWRGKEVRGVVHDESAYALSSHMTPGSAGLFSTVPDLLIFVQMLLNNGKSKGKKYFSEDILKKIESNQIANLGESTGLGFELSQDWYMGRYATEHTFGKTGFTGCHIVCDRKKNKALVLLSNSIYPKRPKNKDKINAVRRDLSDVILSESN